MFDVPKSRNRSDCQQTVRHAARRHWWMRTVPRGDLRRTTAVSKVMMKLTHSNRSKNYGVLEGGLPYALCS